MFNDSFFSAFSKKCATLVWWTLAIGMMPSLSWAVPSFARQTGQNCIACHAGGQYPELTPYGRLFKLTGYTIGERAVPISAMGVVGSSRMKNVDGVSTSLANNGQDPLPTPINKSLSFETGSLFLAGKISDNVGGFVQVTYDRFAAPDANGDNTIGHSGADTMDIRFADQIVTPSSNLIYGVSLNNNPSVSDPWNTAWAWANYVPATGGKGSNAYIDASTPYPSNGLSGNAAGLSTYLFWNKTFYGELGLYRTANNSLSFMNAGRDYAPINGTNPYWRLAYNKEVGMQSFMVGLSGATMHPYDLVNGVSYSDSSSYYAVKSKGMDFQYQYLLDPHTITVQAMHQNQMTTPSALDAAINGTGVSTTNVSRLKSSYVYLAKYGGSLSLFNLSGDVTPTTSGRTFELFYIPVQNIRLGVQYTTYSQLAYIDNPSDANSIRLYAWFAY